MSEHEEHAERLEREAADMQEQGERLESRIEGARQDWEAKKRDGSVPGAAGDPERADTGEGDAPPPELQYPAKGD
jgi:hypothetical protein